MSDKRRNGRPPRLSPRDEFELYAYRKSGVPIKTCASMWRVSVPTVNRIIAKFRAHDERIGTTFSDLREKMLALMPKPPAEPPKPRPPRTTTPERREARFWAKVSNANVRGRCWLWGGYTKPSGHGLTTYQGKSIHAHRLAWIYKRGEIESDLSVNHKCRNPTCCNPEHLYLGTRADNMHDRFYRKPMRVVSDRSAPKLEIASD
jgi:hypothetical protein